MVVFAVLLLLPGTPSLIPEGGATVATLAIAPLTPAVPARVKVTLPPLGSVGMTMPLPCSSASVVFGPVGQAAPPVGPPHVTVVALKLATAGSVTTALLAAAGPLLVTTSV